MDVNNAVSRLLIMGNRPDMILEEFLQRPSISDEEFISRVGLSGETVKQAVKCYRSKLGEIYRIPADKLYPDRSFGELIRYPNSGWDMLEIIFILEDTLEVEINEEQVPNWTHRQTTLGQWIAELLSRCFFKTK